MEKLEQSINKILKMKLNDLYDQILNCGSTECQLGVKIRTINGIITEWIKSEWISVVPNYDHLKFQSKTESIKWQGWIPCPQTDAEKEMLERLLHIKIALGKEEE